MKEKENYLSVGKARTYLGEVLAIVEKEMVKYGEGVRTYQERRDGRVVGEGIVVDVNFDTAQGCYFDTRTICWHMQSNCDDKCFLRYASHQNGYTTDMPMHGTPQEAAAYLLEEYREIFNFD